MSDRSGGEPQHSGGSQESPQGGGRSAGPPYYQSGTRVKWPWIVAALALVFILLLGGCFAVAAVFVNEVDDEFGSEVTVRYQVEGAGDTASIVYLGRDLGMAEETAAVIPWAKDVTINSWGKIVSLTATNAADGGDITCRILVGDRVLAQQTSTGPHASANCSGDAGAT